MSCLFSSLHNNQICCIALSSGGNARTSALVADVRDPLLPESPFSRNLPNCGRRCACGRSLPRAAVDVRHQEKRSMPSISAFYGIIVYMYFMDNKQHKLPHIHVKYSGDEVIVSIPEGNVLEGSIPFSKMKLLQAWVEIHKEELMADWELAVSGEQPYKIDPLR